MNMLPKLATAAGAVAMLMTVSATRVEAVPINGSLPLVALGLAQNGANLSISTNFTVSSWATSSAGLGDYSPIPALTNYGADNLDLTDLGGFLLSNATFGSFDAQAAGSFIVNQSANFLDVFLLGTYTPGPGLAAGLEASLSGLRISINQTGDSVSAAVTLATPPVPPTVPAPASLAVFGAALAGLAAIRRRRS